MAYINFDSHNEPSWANAASAMAGELGLSPVDASSAAFWGGQPALEAMIKSAMAQRADATKERIAARTADSDASSRFDSARMAAIISRLNKSDDRDMDIAKIGSNERLQETLKRMGLQETAYKEGQKNVRTDKQLASKDQLAKEMMEYRKSNINANISDDTAMRLARNKLAAENPKFTPEDLIQEVTRIKQSAKRAPDSGDFLKQAAGEKLKANSLQLTDEDMQDTPMSFMNTLQEVPGSFGPEFTGAPQVGGSVMGDYSVTPQDREASRAYYSQPGAAQGSARFGGNYGESGLPRGANPMAKFASDYKTAAQMEQEQGGPRAVAGLIEEPSKMDITGKRLPKQSRIVYGNTQYQPEAMATGAREDIRGYGQQGGDWSRNTTGETDELRGKSLRDSARLFLDNIPGLGAIRKGAPEYTPGQGEQEIEDLLTSKGLPFLPMREMIDASPMNPTMSIVKAGAAAPKLLSTLGTLLNRFKKPAPLQPGPGVMEGPLWGDALSGQRWRDLTFNKNKAVPGPGSIEGGTWADIPVKGSIQRYAEEMLRNRPSVTRAVDTPPRPRSSFEYLHQAPRGENPNLAPALENWGKYWRQEPQMQMNAAKQLAPGEAKPLWWLDDIPQPNNAFWWLRNF